MRLSGVELSKPTMGEVLVAAIVLLLTVILFANHIGLDIIGAIFGGVISSLFGIRVIRSFVELLMAGCCGLIGGLAGSALMIVLH